MDNSTTTTTTVKNCDLTEVSPSFTIFAYITYFAVAPIYFILGSFGHVACLLAYRLQMKVESAYLQQILVTLSESAAIVFSFLYAIPFMLYLSGNSELFLTNYSYVWYSTHINSFTMHCFLTCTLLLSNLLAVDRIYALVKPIEYRQVENRATKHVTASAICLIVAVVINIFEIFQCKVIEYLPGHYITYPDDAYITAPWVVASTYVRVLIRVSGTMFLIFSNFVLFRFYRKRFVQIDTTIMSLDTEEIAKRKENEKLLVVVTVCQSILVTVGMLTNCIYYILMYSSANFIYTCACRVLGVVADFNMQVSECANFYIMIGYSPAFRRIIVEAFKDIKLKLRR